MAENEKAEMTTMPVAGVSPWNVPNLLTTVRFVLAIAVIAMIAVGWFASAFVAFLVAASTDWMDGYWARKYGQVTKLGRIFDPFVDKIIICGAFIALVEIAGSGIAAWMAIIVVARELLVTSLRGLIEGAGGDFSASSLGKWKMVLQCVAVAAVLLQLAKPTWLVTNPMLSTGFNGFCLAAIWGAVALTVYSGFDYVMAAARIMGREPEGQSPG